MAHVQTGRLDEAERERRRVRSRRLIIGFFLFIGCIVVLESPLTRVRSFQVAGNRSIPSNRVIGESGVEKGMSLWQVNGQAVEHSIMKHEPLVDSVSTHTDYVTGRVMFNVHEKHVVAVYVDSGKYYLILNDGVVYMQTTVQSGFSWPIVTADSSTGAVHIGQPLTNSSVSVLCEQLTGLSSSMLSTLSELHVDSFGVVSLFLTNGFEVECKATDFTQTLPNINEVIQYFSTKGYSPGLIDMTGQAPYRYTPFSNANRQQGGSP